MHRYPDRVLLKVAAVCPVYCRFCFRREMVGPDERRCRSPTPISTPRSTTFAHIPEIWEVILTGGDPFVLSPRRIADITARLGEIAHVKILRWHTRVPVVAPERVTADLVAALRSARQTVYVALHANHPRELTPRARDAIALLADAGIPLVSQTVLLKGVNDDVATLEALMRAFVEARVKPYYLHHGDLAPGTAHFRTTIARRTGADARAAPTALGPCAADLRARHPRRPWQGADRPQHVTHDGERASQCSTRRVHRTPTRTAAPQLLPTRS